MSSLNLSLNTEKNRMEYSSRNLIESTKIGPLDADVQDCVGQVLKDTNVKIVVVTTAIGAFSATFIPSPIPAPYSTIIGATIGLAAGMGIVCIKKEIENSEKK
jgi:hypothetical protein